MSDRDKLDELLIRVAELSKDIEYLSMRIPRNLEARLQLLEAGRVNWWKVVAWLATTGLALAALVKGFLL